MQCSTAACPDGDLGAAVPGASRLSIEGVAIQLQLMEAFVQHLLNAGFEAGQQRPDVLYQDVIQGFGQVVQTTVGRHAAVLWV